MQYFCVKCILCKEYAVFCVKNVQYFVKRGTIGGRMQICSCEKKEGTISGKAKLNIDLKAAKYWFSSAFEVYL